MGKLQRNCAPELLGRALLRLLIFREFHAENPYAFNRPIINLTYRKIRVG